MGLFSKKAADPGAAPAVPQSETTTLSPSNTPSVVTAEKTYHTDAIVIEKTPSSERSRSDTNMHAHETAFGGSADKTISYTTAGAHEETALEKEEQAALQVQGEEDEVVYPSGPKLMLITVALCLSVFLMAIDNTIIATAIPRITDQFNSLADVGWYGSAYLLTTCSLQLFFGKLYTFFSIKYVYLGAILVFEIGSAICGSAPSSIALIIGRAVAGIGSAGIFSGAFTIIAYTVPLVQRPIYTGIIGAMYGIASIAGPLLGGAFTDGPGWGWCFYINLPLGAITILVIMFFFQSPNRKSEQKVSFMVRAKQLDLGGLVVFVAAIVTLLLALQWGGSKYPWGSWRIILCLVVFSVLAVVWLGVQWYMGENATVPFNLIKQRSVAAACAWAFCLGGAFFVLIYWVPIWFQAIKGASALKSGIMCLPMVLSLVVANIICGIGTTKIGYYNPFYYLSVVFASIGAGLLTTFTVNTGAGKWITYQIIYGLGVGFGMQQALITVQAVLPLKDIPVGTAMAAFTQTFGGALFVSAAQNIFNNQLIRELPAQAPGVNPLIVIHSGATSLKDQIPAQFLHGVQLAYNKALTETWYAAVALSVITVIPAVFVEWKSVKGMKPGGGHA